MWETFLHEYTGGAFMDFFPSETSQTLKFYTDASFGGAGRIFGAQWFQITYPACWRELNITYLEMYPIVVAAHIFANQLANKSVIFHIDNYAVMCVLNKCTSPNPKSMPLICKLVLLYRKYNDRTWRAMHTGFNMHRVAVQAQGSHECR